MLWTENLYDIRNDVAYMVKLLEDMRVDLKDFYNLELDHMSDESDLSSNVALIESNVDDICASVLNSSNDSSNEDVIKAIDRLDATVSNLDSKIEKNNELLSELIKVMKEKN